MKIRLTENRILLISLAVSVIFMTANSNMLHSEDKHVTLQECINVALFNNPDKLISIENNEISRHQYQIAKAQRGLQVDGQIKTYQVDNTGTDGEFKIPGVNTDIGLFAGLYSRYKLYDKSSAEKEKTAKLDVSLAKNASLATVNVITYNVKQAYYQLLLANDKLVLKKELLYKYKEKLKLTKKLFMSGRRPILDVSQAEVNVAEAMLNFEKARNDVRARRSDLLIVMGIEESEGVNLIPVQVSKLSDLKYNIKELDILASHYNPDIRSSRLLKHQKRLLIDVARGTQYPRVDLLLSLGFQNTQLYLFDSTDGNFLDNFKYGRWSPIIATSISFSLPVFYGGALSSSVDKALAEYNKMTIKHKETKTKLNVSIRNIYNDLVELKKQMKMSKLIIKNSEKHALLALRSYENGIGSITSLQDAEARVITSEMNFLGTKYSYLLKLAMLAQLVGIEEGKICRP